jgi:ketosteroid isomerase-like protein
MNNREFGASTSNSALMVIALFDAKGTARDGQTYANTYAWVLRLNEEKIVEAHAFLDSIAFDDLWKRVPERAVAK